MINLGYCQLVLGRYEEARANFEKAAGPEARLALARLHITLEDYPAARRLLEDGLKEMPRLFQILGKLILAESYAAEGRFQDSLRAAREAEQLVTEEADQLNLWSHLTLTAIYERFGPESDLHQTLALTIDAARDLGISPGEGSPSPRTVQMLALIAKLSARNGNTAGAVDLQALMSTLLKETPPAAWQAYFELVEGEILAAKGNHTGAQEKLTNAVALADSFQAHESLARTLEAADQPAAAIAQYQWLIDHRGQGLVECHGLCYGLSVIDWAMASYHLGRLYERQGQREEAVQAYRRFVGLWQEGNDLKAWQDATRRLAALTSDGATSDGAGR